MSYRPEGWRTPNVIALKEVKAGFVMADQVRFLTKDECKAYEAGADAMLGALLKDGNHVMDIPKDSFYSTVCGKRCLCDEGEI